MEGIDNRLTAKLDMDGLTHIVRKVISAAVIRNKRFIIAANWKMNKDSKETAEFLKLMNSIEWDARNSVIIFPPAPYLFLARELLKRQRTRYGLQNICWENSGAFTGEVSPPMAVDMGCEYVIIGHSERRNLFLEPDEMLEKKVISALQHGLVPILCIGENLDERKGDKYREKLRLQIHQGLKGLRPEDAGKVVLAYEPIWAIGTGVNATSGQVEETHCHIKDVLDGMFGREVSGKIPVLYGGSVKASNVLDLAVAENVSGFLIGGASLKFEEFKEIIRLLD